MKTEYVVYLNLMSKYFLLEFNRKFGKSFTHFSQETEAALVQFRYTGNVRELKNLIERQALLSNGPGMTIPEICLADSEQKPFPKLDDSPNLLPPLLPTGIDFPGAIMRIEKQYMMDALDMADGNETQAAKLLGLSRDAFRYRRKSHQ